MQQELPEHSVVRIFPRRLAGRLGWLSVFLVFAPLVVDVVARAIGARWATVPADLAFLLVFGLAPLMGAVAGYLRVFGLRRPGSAVATTDALVIGNETVPKSDVLAGFVSPMPLMPRGAIVELELVGGRTASLQVASLEEGDALLRSLDLGPSRRAMRVSFANHGRRVVAGLAAGAGWFAGSMYALIMLAPTLGIETPLGPLGIALLLSSFVFVPWLLMMATRPCVVVIGAEGITIHRGWAERRFIGFERIADIDPGKKGVVISLHGGAKVEIGDGITEAGERGSALIRRIREVLESRANEQLSRAKVALLARKDRGVREWRAALARLGAGDAGYRSVGLSPQDLEHVLDSDGESAEHKLGAALALRALSPETAGERVRIAADRAASDRVRVALQAISSGEEDDEALEEALREAEVRAR